MTENKEVKWKMVTFKEMAVPCWFHYNGLLCCKIDKERYMSFNEAREECKITEWDRNDFAQANLVDITYQYRRL